MLLTTSEGSHWRYEVCEHADGYLVQMRDLNTGDLDEDFSTIFRTMPVAFAYAEMSAAYERYAAAELEAGDDQIEIDLALSEQNFLALSNRLRDDGVTGMTIRAWEEFNSGPITRHVLH